MKSVLYVVAACICIALGCQIGSAQTSPRSQFGHLKDVGGQFNDHVFTLWNKFEENPVTRRYRASIDDCSNYLKYYQHHEYHLSGLDELILLDWCLGYLYETESNKIDKKKRANSRKNLQPYFHDPTLRQLFTETQIENLSNEGKTCLMNLLHQYISTFEEHSTTDCSDHWMRVLDDFAKCHKSITRGIDIGRDSYLRLVYEFLKDQGRICFQEQVDSLVETVRLHYKDLDGENMSISTGDSDTVWPKPISKLLKVVQGDRRRLHLGEINKIIAGMSRNNPNERMTYVNKFKFNVYRSIFQSDESPESIRYREKVDKLCRFFRGAGENYDFRTPFVKMANMLRSPEIYGTTRKRFKNVVLSDINHTALYLCVASCEYLDHTQSAAMRNKRTGTIRYVVKFMNTDNMVRWPDISIMSI